MSDISELQQVNKTLREIAENMQPGLFKKNGEKNEEVVSAIKAASDKRSALSKEEQKLFEALRKELNQKNKFTGKDDVIKVRGEKTQYAKFAAKLEETAKIKFTNLHTFEEALKALEEAAIAAGTTLKKEGIEKFKPMANMNQKQTIIIRDGIRMAKKKIKKTEEEIIAIDKTLALQEKLDAAYDKHITNLRKLGGVVKNITKDFLKFAEQEQRYAQATATADAGWIDGIMQMGVSQLEYMKILKDTRQESLAAAAGGVDFKASLSASAESLRGMTSSYSEAAKGAAFFHKNMARIGVSQDQLGDAVAQQTTMYEKNYRALGYTVEEFANLTNELINDQGMRSTLLGLQESERKAYILSVQQRQAEYLTMGYTIERAKELQKTFQALNKMSPKERMKQAAKTRAMMGAMGMGSEGARLFELQTQYRTMGAKQKAAAEKEMAEIQAGAAKKFGAMSGAGSSMGQAMVMQTMADKTGFTQIADSFETETGQGLVFDKKQLAKTNEISGFVSKILGYMSTWDAAKGSAVTSIATTIATSIATTIATSIATALGAVLGAKLLGRPAAKLAGVGGVGGAIAGIGKGVKGTAGAVTGAAGMMGKKAMSGLSKGAAKTALRAIPGIGLIAALGFMGSRIADGDYLGAGMELAAGTMGLLPGLGTAGAIGMSGAIVARDLTKTAGRPEGTSLEIEDTTMAASTMSQESILVELNNTMLTLNEYLLSTTEANTDQAKALDKTAKAMQEQQRYFALPDSRATA